MKTEVGAPVAERSTAFRRFTGLDAEGVRAFKGSGLGWGLDGMDWMMYSFVTGAIMATLSVSTNQIATIASLSLAASAFGGILGGLLADRYGRARVLVFIILGYAISTALCATAQNFEQLAIWRTVAGAAFGAEWGVGAALLAEYAHNAKRGRLMGLLQSCYAVGWAGAGLLYLIASSTLSQEASWRVLFLIGLAPALLAAYVRRHVRDNVRLSRDSRSKLSLLFRRAQVTTTLRATLLAASCQSIYYSVFTFLPLFLAQRRGLSVSGSSLYVWIAILGSLCGYICAGFIHDRLGRRRTFTLYFLGSGAALLVFLVAPVGGVAGTIIAAFPLGFFAAGQTAGLGAYLAELHPTDIRATGQAFAYSAGRGISGFATSAVGGVTAALGLGGAIAAVGMASCALALLFLWTLPETNGVTIVGEEAREAEEARRS